MKLLNKKILTTTLAASIVLGGGIAGLLQSKAFADETSTDSSTPAVTQPGGFKHMKTDKRGAAGLEIDPAKLADAIGITKEDLNAQLKAGQTLLQIGEANGYTRDSLNAAIRQIFNNQIDNSVNSGKITSEQADEQRAKLSEVVDKLLTRAGNEQGKGLANGFGKGPGGKPGLFGNTEELTSVLGITAEELKTALSSGQSIAEIAQAQGISEDDLINKIKDGLTDKLKKMVESKRQPHEKKAQPADSNTDAPAVSDDAAAS